jgi:hypothetical protein
VLAATANGRDSTLQTTLPGVGKKVHRCYLGSMGTSHLVRSLRGLDWKQHWRRSQVLYSIFGAPHSAGSHTLAAASLGFRLVSQREASRRLPLTSSAESETS